MNLAHTELRDFSNSLRITPMIECHQGCGLELLVRLDPRQRAVDLFDELGPTSI
jgi:hypothetical protein